MTLGIVVGWVVAALLGIYDAGGVHAAPWIGVPAIAWPGFHVRLDAGYLLLLLALLFIMLITTIESVSDVVAVQAVSWRRARVIDFRAVQGAVNACALSNLLAGITGTMPHGTYGGSCASLIELNRGRGAHRGRVCGDRVHPAGIPAQGDGAAGQHTVAGGGRLRDGCSRRCCSCRV